MMCIQDGRFSCELRLSERRQQREDQNERANHGSSSGIMPRGVAVSGPYIVA